MRFFYLDEDRMIAVILRLSKVQLSNKAIFLHNDKLFYADQLNKKISEVLVSQEKRTHIDSLKLSILNMKANDSIIDSTGLSTSQSLNIIHWVFLRT